MEADRVPDRQHSHAEILPYYRTADLCLVTSLHDGMNLVAKEFVARGDDQGVLILSRFAGRARIGGRADRESLRHRADGGRHSPGPRDAARRAPHAHAADAATVREHNVYRWAGKLIEELCEVRPVSTAAAPYLVRTAMRRSAS